MKNAPLGDVIGRLIGERRVWVRIAVHRLQQEWRLAVLEVTTGKPPRRWHRLRWSYPRAVFVAPTPAGKTVAGWLARGRVPLRAGATKATLQESCSVERCDANAEGIFESVDDPVDPQRIRSQRPIAAAR